MIETGCVTISFPFPVVLRISRRFWIVAYRPPLERAFPKCSTTVLGCASRLLTAQKDYTAEFVGSPPCRWLAAVPRPLGQSLEIVFPNCI